MTNYELHEFDPVKVFTGEINPLEVNSFKYEAYNTNTLGQIVIDKNNLTDAKRKFISLATKKTSYAKFNQIIDVEFDEFVIKNVADSLDFLLAKINSLESERETLRVNRDIDREQIDSLNKQIEELRTRLNAINNAAAVVNKISNILKYGQQLVAGSEKQITGSLSTGSLSTTQGITGSLSTSPSSSFTPITIPGDRLLSKNRKYIAQVQGDRNFVVKKGEFDERGYPLEDSVVEIFNGTIQADRGVSLWSNVSGYYILKFVGSILEIGLEDGGDDYLGNAEVIAYVAEGFSPNAKLILEDSGRLVVTNNSQAVRTF
jgi:prefoldin subunit 5